MSSYWNMFVENVKSIYDQYAAFFVMAGVGVYLGVLIYAVCLCYRRDLRKSAQRRQVLGEIVSDSQQIGPVDKSVLAQQVNALKRSSKVAPFDGMAAQDNPVPIQ